MKTQRTALFLAALLAVSSIVSCGGENPSGDDTTTAGGDTTVAQAPEYDFPKYEGELRVLNIEDCYSMHAVIDTLETNGDTLNDLQFNTVRKFEEMTGVQWVEQNEEVLNGITAIVSKVIPAGEDNYDIIYQSNSQNYHTYTSEGYYYNLLDYEDNLNLDEPWFIDAFNSIMTVNGQLYTALGHSHLCTTDAISILNFNQSMMEDLGLELPYQKVIDSTWTMDVLLSYTKAAGRLNGDAEFKWTADGNCTWGIVLPNNNAGWYMAAGEPLISNENGKLVLNGGTERFYKACEASANMYGATDGSIYMAHYNGDDLPDSYIGVFENQRALFGGSEIAKANRMRNMDFTFGILPYPKLDETQDRYYSTVSYPACGISIPVTCKTPERSAELGDAINYLFYKDVWPVFREVTLEQKNLRNEESIEMLDIILNSIAPNLAGIYAIGADYRNELGVKLRAGDSAVTSLLAAHKSAIEEQLNKING